MQMLAINVETAKTNAALPTAFLLLEREIRFILFSGTLVRLDLRCKTR